MDDDKLKARMGTALAIAFCAIIIVVVVALTIKFLDWLF